MTERPGAARGALTIAQAQELILAQAEAARRVLPEIPQPNMALSFFPVAGPLWQAAADFKDGDYPAAGFNAGVAVADLFGAGVVGKGLKAAEKGITPLKRGSLTDAAARQAYRAAGMTGKGDEVSHMFGFRGIDRKAPNWRNHYMFLKALPKETHRRLTGRWGKLERFNPAQRFWYGTNDWVKVAPPAVTARGADVVDNLNRPRPTGSPASKNQGKR